jgi:hypothetical protein
MAAGGGAAKVAAALPVVGVGEVGAGVAVGVAAVSNLQIVCWRPYRYHFDFMLFPIVEVNDLTIMINWLNSSSLCKQLAT